MKAGLSAHPLVEASMGHPKAPEDLLALQADHSADLLWVIEALSADFIAVVLEAFIVAASPADIGSHGGCLAIAVEAAKIRVRANLI